VLALVASFAVRAAALAGLDGWTAVGGLVAAHSLGRGAAVALMVRLPVAGGGGLGAAYVSDLTRRQGGTGVVLAVAVAVVTLRGWAAVALVVAGAAALVVGWWARTRVGGVTGDVLGATEQVAEVAVLLVAVALA
jgi:adenosylcobinamide-GDP ribazoletransferase